VVAILQKRLLNEDASGQTAPSSPVNAQTEQGSLLTDFRNAFRKMYRDGDPSDFEALQRDPRMVKAQGLDLSSVSLPSLPKK